MAQRDEHKQQEQTYYKFFHTIQTLFLIVGAKVVIFLQIISLKGKYFFLYGIISWQHLDSSMAALRHYVGTTLP
jgi:hypothetical protein